MTIAPQGKSSPPVIAICGVKNSGKTTLIENLIPRLSQKGCRVAVVKHDGHQFQPDVPGTDSHRLSQAGAAGVGIFSSSRYMVVQEHPITFHEMLGFFPAADLILLEGGKHSAYPKIELVRSAVSAEPVCSPGALMALCTDTAFPPPGVQVFGLQDYDDLTAFILNHVSWS